MLKKMLILNIFALMVCLSGCGKTDQLSSYETDGLGYIAYTDIDTICEDPVLIQEGDNFLSSVDTNLLLSYVVDSNIEISEELGSYEHLIMTNPQCIERFGNVDKLKPVEYKNLSSGMQEFLEAQMSVLTVTGEALPTGIELYKYDGDGLLAFPVNVTLGAAEPIEAQNSLVILVNTPSETLKIDTCLLPLISSGNILFADVNEVQATFEESKLKDYGTVQELNSTH